MEETNPRTVLNVGPPHRQRPSFPYNYSISSCAYRYVVACRAESMVENGRYWNATYDRAAETGVGVLPTRSFQDIEEMNGIGCRAKLHCDNYLLAPLCPALLATLKNNACLLTVRIVLEFYRLPWLLRWINSIFHGVCWEKVIVSLKDVYWWPFNIEFVSSSFISYSLILSYCDYCDLVKQWFIRLRQELCLHGFMFLFTF